MEVVGGVSPYEQHDSTSGRLLAIYASQNAQLLFQPRKCGIKSNLTESQTTGRFSIIDKFAKDSSDSDDDGPPPTARLVKSSAQQTVRTYFSQSVDSRCSSTKATASSTPSRFRIVPLESKYKRGRWHCFDYYDKEPSIPAESRITESGVLQQTIANRDRSVRSLTCETLQRATLSVHTPVLYDGSSESDRENNDVFARSTPAFSRTITVQPRANSICPTDASAPLNAKKEPNRFIRRAPNEKLQKGLENSLSPVPIRSLNNPKRPDLLYTGSVVPGVNGTGHTSTSAIDSKIEQAMDLVKTHLMYAVREELDALRGKISELERHVFRLETENALLRANINDDILTKLALNHAKK
ncbi:hypothetical protein KIN20_023856 [Parelaphostrongylus tenuis]|uniref:Uncharacterized protein n=1 Tax=Parelaphostrongylus tenuis TaxID=148309 RepID=A0AAD5QVK8_PARTN|nr:hypothetical protein KIN20_023856 [Parelaphostrongylus tenuis]